MIIYESYRDRETEFYVGYETSTSINLHFHNCFELIYAVDGETIININGVAHPLSTGQMSACNCFSVHNTDMVREGKFIVALIPHKYFREYDNILNNNSFINPVINDTEDHFILSLLNAAYKLYNDHNILDNEFSAHPQNRNDAQKQIALLLINLCICKCGLQPCDLTTSLVSETLNILEAEFDRDIKVSNIAYRLHCNQTELSQQFKNMLGMSIIKYLNNIRISEAKQYLILRHDLSIEEIMEKCGFGSMRSFIRNFKEISGCTPSEFRQNTKL